MEKHTVKVVPLSVTGSRRQDNQSRDQETNDHWPPFDSYSDSGMPEWQSRDCKCRKKDKKCRKHSRKHGDHNSRMPPFMSRGPFAPHVRPPFVPGSHMFSRGRGGGPMFRGRSGPFSSGHPYFYGSHFVDTGFFKRKENQNTSFCLNLSQFKANEISVTIEGDALKIHAKHDSRADETGNPSCEVNIQYDITGRETTGVRGLLGDDGHLEIRFRDTDDSDDDVVEVPSPVRAEPHDHADEVEEDGDTMYESQ